MTTKEFKTILDTLKQDIKNIKQSNEFRFADQQQAAIVRASKESLSNLAKQGHLYIYVDDEAINIREIEELTK
jgi:predicted Zn-dependent peptidase